MLCTRNFHRPLRLGPVAPRVSDPRAGEEPRRPVLTGGKLFRWRRRCQRAHHAEPHRLGGWSWPSGVTVHATAAAHSPERKEAAKLGSYLDDGSRERAQARQGPKAELLAARIEEKGVGGGVRRRRGSGGARWRELPRSSELERKEEETGWRAGWSGVRAFGQL